MHPTLGRRRSPRTIASTLLGVGVALAAGFPWAGTARAVERPIPGKILVAKQSKVLKGIFKPPSGGAFTLPTLGSPADPLQGGQVRITVRDASVAGGNFGETLLAGSFPNGWKGLGNPPGSKGFKYKNSSATVLNPCKVVLLKENIIKFVCKGSGASLPQAPFGGPANIALDFDSAGGGDRYCAEFGGTEIKNQQLGNGLHLLKRKDAPAPVACSCCNNLSYHSFTVLNGADFCGSLLDTAGAPAGAIACTRNYVGGGATASGFNPIQHPNQGQLVTEITACSAEQATLGPTTAGATGSLRNCTAPGCLFGAPQPVPNTFSTPTSLCVVTTVAENAAGNLNCETGAMDLDLPLDMEFFLTGDSDAGTPGIQTCPRCDGGTCKGGPNDGVACTPGTSLGLIGYETSHDCPPDPFSSIGSLSTTFALSTGTTSWTGVSATNPTSTQARVFSGYCRDANGTGDFESPAKRCWEGGVAVGTPCAEPFESCEQRNQGAFGPGGSTVKTITVTGSPDPDDTDIRDGQTLQVLSGVYSVSPTFTPSLDAALDLPGPGALGLVGTGELCASANPCP